MHLPSLLKTYFESALAELTDDTSKYAEMIKSTNDPKFGDYQANCAMPLGKSEGKNPREIAQTIVDKLAVDEICEPPEIAGPGFINLTIKQDYLESQLLEMIDDPRCLVAKTSEPKTIVIDYSSPNVAKPMHVGHIRSTVIGDALAKTLSFLGHNVITDNHLGDWGTQFGIIIYGYKHFGDPETVRRDPINELLILYRKVNQLITHKKNVASIVGLEAGVEQATEHLQVATNAVEEAKASDDKKLTKKAEKKLKSATKSLAAAKQKLAETNQDIATVESDSDLMKAVAAHPNIDVDILQETAKLHQGDEANLALWNEFLPFCKDEINRVYDRLNIAFDHTLGESFYHPMLAGVVETLKSKGLATESDGAICVFLEQFEAPMIVQKKDGAYLYSTTDLATIQYRLQEFQPDEILYVVDTRQKDHFKMLFAVAELLDMQDVKLAHVNFGTVLDRDGKPMKTRSGTLIGLESLLDDAVAGARAVVCNPDRLSKLTPPLSEGEQTEIANVIGHSAVKYADLSHHRTTDYKFDLEKMVALSGNTATYVQYCYARTQSILKKVGVNESEVLHRVQQRGIKLTQAAERRLAMSLLRFEEGLVAARDEYAPNLLVETVHAIAQDYSSFNDDPNCHVMNAETTEMQTTRLALVTLTGRVLKLGLSLLGIDTVKRM